MTCVVVHRDESGGWNLDLNGQTVALLALGLRTHNAPGETQLDPGVLSSANVFGARFDHWLQLSRATDLQAP